jgi:mevalonate kinase
VQLCRHIIGDGNVRIDISSDIPPTYGFGSSAALVAALVKAAHGGKNFTEMFGIGHAAILKTFGRGSGADLAAALADRPFIVFDPAARTARDFDLPFSVQAVYTGYKTPTPEAISRVRARLDDAAWKAVTAKMRDCVERFIAAPAPELVAEYQGYMDALGVTCDATRRALDLFAGSGAAAKISGAGLGDCVVGFSAAPVVLDVSPPLEFLSREALCA